MPRLMSCSKRDPRLDDAVGRQAGLGHAQVQRHVRPRLGEAAVDFDHVPRIGILERHAIAREAEFIEQPAVIERAVEHRREPVGRIVLRLLGRVDAAAVDADAHRAVVVARRPATR